MNWSRPIRSHLAVLAPKHITTTIVSSKSKAKKKSSFVKFNLPIFCVYVWIYECMLTLDQGKFLRLFLYTFFHHEQVNYFVCVCC